MSDNNDFNLNLIGNARHGYLNRVRFDMPCKRTATIQNVRVDLWDGPTGTYVPPAAPIQMQVVSASANDTAPGTGARSVHIHYLDTNYAKQYEQVTLNGVTPVNTVATNILRVNAMHVDAIGSTGAAVGIVSLQAVGGAVTYARIAATQNRARQPMFTVPAGMVAYVKQWQASSASPTAAIQEIDLRATSHDGERIPGVFMAQDQSVGQYIIENVIYAVPLVFPEKVDIKVTAISAGATDNATAASNIVGWLE